MRFVLLLVSLALCGACEERQPPASDGARTSPAARTDDSRAAVTTSEPTPGPAFPLRVQGTHFADAQGRPFPWRGISAFRLAEMLAGGRESEAAAYLDWAAKEQLTVVRVLLMAKHLFQLPPEAGRAALPRLLDLAKARGLAVEAVALADTKEYSFDIEAHVRDVGRVAAEKGNAFVEIANEPGHPTQDPRLHDPAFAKRLASLLPDGVISAFGSAEYDDGYAGGDYATYHFSREPDWRHVTELGRGAAFLAKWQKPVVNDEPIGAAAEYQRGRRENDPAKFAAAAALTTFVGMGGTFHYEGGLQARIPTGREAACLAAWQMGTALVAEAQPSGALLDVDGVASIARVSGARAVFARAEGSQAKLLLLDAEKPEIEWRDGWSEVRRNGVPGVLLVTARRSGLKP